jgi:hypothetical protein
MTESTMNDKPVSYWYSSTKYNSGVEHDASHVPVTGEELRVYLCKETTESQQAHGGHIEHLPKLKADMENKH